MRCTDRILAAGVICATLGAFSAMAQMSSSQSGTAPGDSSSQGAPVPKLGTYQAVLLHPEALNAKAPEEYEVKFVTTAGDFTVKVMRAWAPNGADRFYNLVLHHFYDGSSFFRVVRGFMAQFGLSPYPPVNVAWLKATIKDDPMKQSNHRGYVTFAKSSERNSRNTQIFINLVDNPALDGNGFAPFGQITEGMENVDKIYSGYGESDPQGNGPRQDYVMGRGHFYLEKNFPRLDVVRSATFVTTGAEPGAAQVPGK